MKTIKAIKSHVNDFSAKRLNKSISTAYLFVILNFSPLLSLGNPSPDPDDPNQGTEQTDTSGIHNKRLAEESFKAKDRDLATTHYIAVIKSGEKNKDKSLMVTGYNGLGKINRTNKNPAKALEYYQLALDTAKTSSDPMDEIITMRLIGEYYLGQGENASALNNYFLPGLQQLKESGTDDDDMLSKYLTSIGTIYVSLQNYQEAEKYLLEALMVSEKTQRQDNIAMTCFNLGDVYRETERYNLAFPQYTRGLDIGKNKNDSVILRNAYNRLYLYYDDQGDAVNALKNHKIYFQLYKAMLKKNTEQLRQDAEKKFETEKKNKEIKEQQLKIAQQQLKITQERSAKEKMRIWTVGAIVLVVGTSLFAVLVLRKNKIISGQKKELDDKNVILTQQKEEIQTQNEELQTKNEEITTQRDEIEAQRDEVIKQKEIIQKQHNDIEESIAYTTRIQNAVLGPKERLGEMFPESFMIWKPQHTVSGDFYRFKKVGGKKFFAGPDSTGHGVPGATMSVLNSDFLNDAVKDGNTNPASILNYANADHPEKFNQKQLPIDKRPIKDTMDIAICAVDENNVIEIACAKNPVIIIKHTGELIEIKGDDDSKIALGSNPGTYTNDTRQGEVGDRIYVFSDGFPDQFGGPDDKKFKIKNFRNLLLETVHMSIEEQGKVIEQAFELRRGKREQIDDVIVIGVRIT